MGMQEEAVWIVSASDLLVTVTHLLHTHAHRPIQKHKGGRGILEMLPFLKIENVVETVAGDDLWF